MTETVEITPESPDTETLVERRPNRLNQAVAWVAIVAGVVFIVGSIFFTGFFLGRHGGHAGGPAGGQARHHERAEMVRPMGPPPGMPRMMGPGSDMPPPPPGQTGPNQTGPNPSAAPARP
ncbi:MAG: hypothetical protein KDB71_14945 [Mycobacterium sp.]|nr:hypothetical protein [Mycobacterium sp.]